MTRLIGYARVSTEDQSLDMQLEAIYKYEAQQNLTLIPYIEKISSSKAQRTELKNAMKAATAGDIFVVYKLDRLARSTRELYALTDQLKEKGVELVSLNDNFDTTTPTGKAMFGMLAVFAEFERDIIRQRTIAGLEAARKRGKKGGRPKIEDKTKKHVKTLFKAGERAIDIAKEYDISRATVYNIVNEERRK